MIVLITSDKGVRRIVQADTLKSTGLLVALRRGRGAESWTVDTVNPCLDRIEILPEHDR